MTTNNNIRSLLQEALTATCVTYEDGTHCRVCGQAHTATHREDCTVMHERVMQVLLHVVAETTPAPAPEPEQPAPPTGVPEDHRKLADHEVIRADDRFRCKGWTITKDYGVAMSGDVGKQHKDTYDAHKFESYRAIRLVGDYRPGWRYLDVDELIATDDWNVRDGRAVLTTSHGEKIWVSDTMFARALATTETTT